MQFLILAILSSTLISLAMKLADRYITNTMVMFLTNYCICSCISLFYLVTSDAFSAGIVTKGLSFAAVFGAFNGVFYLLSLIMYKKSINENGMVITAIFMKLGVLIPTIMAVVVFKESISIQQIIGIAVAIFASMYINSGNSDSKDDTGHISVLLLVAIIVINGFIDSASNIYDKVGVRDLKDVFLLFTFFTAFVVSSTIAIKNKKGVSKYDVLFGILVGIPNYFSTRFMLLALATVPAVIAYPVYNVSTIITVSAIGWVVFKEKLSYRRVIGIALILLALALINGWF